MCKLLTDENLSISASSLERRHATDRQSGFEHGKPAMHFGFRLALSLAVMLELLIGQPAEAQFSPIRIGEAVPRDIREMYDKGLGYLATHQTEAGDWQGGDQGPGVTGLCMMVFLASGEDPNFGVYSNVVRKAVRKIIQDQNAETGYLGNSMYHHGFAMLALAEAYGAVDDSTLWVGVTEPAGGGGQSKRRTIGQALELAVRAAITSQKSNPSSAWRYSPADTSADTSVSGAVLVGLLAARNAGIEVPDAVIDKAVKYFVSMTSETGMVGYSGVGSFGESVARSSIATLVYAIARRKDLPQFKQTLQHISERIEQSGNDHYAEYTTYYEAQALFQGDLVVWEKWNQLLVRQLKLKQAADGSFPGSFGPALGTSMSLLGLALNYRFLPIYER